jgi:hypothetical protein
MWRAAVMMMLILGAACGVGFPAAPRQGGPPWTELTSEHFTVWTDAEPARVHQLIRRMERVRHVTAGVAYPTAPTSGRSLAIVLRTDAELSQVNNTGEARAFANEASGPLWQPLVVLSLDSAEHRTVAHELTHLISCSVIHHQPRWLAEGMAAYFEGMQLDIERTTVTLGAAPARYGRSVPIVPIPRLFDWGGISSATEEYALYHTAWALFAFLINERRNQLAHYLWLIDRTGDPANGPWRLQQRRAWDKAFPSLPIEDLDGTLRDWLVNGRHVELRFYIDPKDTPITVRRLGDADAHAIRALAFGGPTPAQEARERVEIAEALAVEPTNVLAWVLKALRGDKPTVDLGRSITAAHPDDWRAWWLATGALEDAHGDPSELEAARGRACALIARNRALVAPPRLCPTRSAGQSSR